MFKMKDFISKVIFSCCTKVKNLFLDDVKENHEEHKELQEPMFEIIIPPQQESVIQENDEKFVRMLTVSEAAKINKVTRQAIFFAIKMKRLPAKKECDTWLISSLDLKKYMKTKYCRDKSKRDGQLVFDKSKGCYSIPDVAKMLKRSQNQIYYLVRMGRIKTHRQGSFIVILEKDLQEFLDIENRDKRRKIVI